MEEKVLSIKSLNELSEAARSILDEMKGERVFAIRGKMGAGKTTMIKAFCKVLGTEEVVSSPTFSLVNEYTDETGESVFHFDFYRIKKTEEVFDIGYEEYLFSGNYCFIEWPELILELLPERYVFISIKENENRERLINYKLIG